MIEKLTNLPDYESTIINQGKEQRLIALTGLLEVYIASEMTMEIYQKLYLSSLTSLQKKKSLAAKQQFYKNLDYSRGRKSVGILGGNDCFSIIAASGTGKTSAIERCIDIIENETEINGVKILKCLTVQTPYDCSIKGLLLEILRVVDLEIGTSYYERTRQSMTVDMLIGIVSTVCLNHICTLIIDEIQNVIRNKNGRNLVGMLTQLINSSGISIVFVGVPESEIIFMTDVYLSRRTIGLRYDAMEYNEEFIDFCKFLWHYQYTEKIEPFSEKYALWLYEHSGGVRSIVKGLLYEAQQIAIMSEIEVINIVVLEKAYKQRYQMMMEHIQPNKKVFQKLVRKKNIENGQKGCIVEFLAYSEMVVKAQGNIINIIKSMKEHYDVYEVSL